MHRSPFSILVQFRKKIKRANFLLPHLINNGLSRELLFAQVPWGVTGRAYLTVLPEVEITSSTIPGAGLGAIATTFIPKYTWLSYYDGYTIVPDEWRHISPYAWTVGVSLFISEQESPPAWTQEAYRPQEGTRCWPPLLTDPPPLDLMPPPPHPPAGPDTPPPPAGPDPPPPSADWPDPPPQVWTKWKHYLPHPSDAGGKNTRSYFQVNYDKEIYWYFLCRQVGSVCYSVKILPVQTVLRNPVQNSQIHKSLKKLFILVWSFGAGILFLEYLLYGYGNPDFSFIILCHFGVSIRPIGNNIELQTSYSAIFHETAWKRKHWTETGSVICTITK